MSPLLTAFVAQLSGALIAVAGAKIFYPKLMALPALWAIFQGIFAALASYKLGAPRWWIPIHLCFLSLVIAAHQLEIHPIAWLAGFVLLLLLFWRTDKSQVPLFLTNTRAAQAIAELLPATPCKCVDLGCGTGSLLVSLATARPDCQFFGVEHAPLPFLLAWLRSRRFNNLNIRYGDFWTIGLSQFQVVYVFLSPIPMARLGQKVSNEMSARSLVISNSFEIPESTASRLVVVPDRRRTRLYCYNTSPIK